MLSAPSGSAVFRLLTADAFRAAAALLRAHGDDAELVAARRADAVLDEGEVLASAYWGRVGRALDDMRRAKLGPGDGRA